MYEGWYAGTLAEIQIGRIFHMPVRDIPSWNDLSEFSFVWRRHVGAPLKGINMAASIWQKHPSLHWVLLRKREFNCRGTHNHKNETFSNSRTVQIAKYLKISQFFNLQGRSLGGHVNAASRRSLEFKRTLLEKEPFCKLYKYCLMKVNARKDW